MLSYISISSSVYRQTTNSASAFVNEFTPVVLFVAIWLWRWSSSWPQISENELKPNIFYVERSKTRKDKRVYKFQTNMFHIGPNPIEKWWLWKRKKYKKFKMCLFMKCLRKNSSSQRKRFSLRKSGEYNNYRVGALGSYSKCANLNLQHNILVAILYLAMIHLLNVWLCLPWLLLQGNTTGYLILTRMWLTFVLSHALKDIPRM